MYKSDKIKGFFAGVIVTSILTVSLSVFASSFEKQILVVYNDIKVNVGGRVVELKDANGNTIEPFTYNGSTYLPVRAISEALSKTITWNADTKTVTIAESSEGRSRPNGSAMTEKMKTSLASLVTAGTITQDQENKLLTYFETDTAPTQGQGPGERVDPFSKAVNDGVITQAEADAIKAAIMPNAKTQN